jgi:multidrug efflux pump subunit AcrA (membrane-fusion protein)
LIRFLVGKFATKGRPYSCAAAATLTGALAAGFFAASAPSFAAGESDSNAYAGAAVTAVKAKKRCFSDTIEVTGLLVPREEVLVRPDREGLQISQVLVEAGDTVTSGQALARLTDVQQGGGAVVTIQAPVAGIIRKVSATVGTMASARAEPLFQIIARGELELLADISTKQISKLSPGQTAQIKIVGVGELTGRVRLVSKTIDPTTQLSQARVFIGNNQRLRVGSFGRATVVAGQSCGVAVPLSAVLYGTESAIVEVVRDNRIETRQVTVGLLSEGEAEIREGLSEADLVVARAGAFLREGDRVRPVVAGAVAGRK